MATFVQKSKYAPFFLASLLPLRVLYFFSTTGFFFIYHILRLRRDVTVANLMRSFPQKSENEIKKTEKSFYRHFCDLFIESAKFLTISEQEARLRFRVLNPEILENFFLQKKSVILYLAHIGNWEWFGTIPLYTRHTVIAFYQPQKNRYFDKLMILLRSRFGVSLVESKHGYKTLIELADRQVVTLSLIVGDQSPSRGSSKYWVRFLNQETAFLSGADRFAKRFHFAVIFPVITKVKRGYYEINLEVLVEVSEDQSSHQIIEEYSRHLESAILKAPEQWLWSHRRWKEL